MKKIMLFLIFILLVFAFFLFFPRKEKINVYFHNENKVKTMELEKYLQGVLAAEMSEGFHIEALKAQAVAARTYTVNKINANVHKGGADICTDSAHCQAYSENYDKNGKIQKAVKETKGEIATYGGVPISAVFHSASCGFTENSLDVWGGELPYLKSVESDDSLCPDYITQVNFKKEELLSLLGIDEFSWEITRSESGRVKEIVLGGCTFKGTEIRNRLNLRSTCFYIEERKENIIFTVKGYGHGVGMSQWGAEAMAREGKNYKKILKHYYKGIKIE